MDSGASIRPRASGRHALGVILAVALSAFALLTRAQEIQTSCDGTCVPQSKEQVAAAAYDAGFRGAALVYAVAIADAESNFQLNAINHNGTSSTDYGLWQINSVHGYSPRDLLSNATYNAQAAFSVSQSGTSFCPWVTFWNGAFRSYLSDPARIAAQAKDSTVIRPLSQEASRVRSTDGVSVRTTAAGSLIRTVNAGATGTVIDGPITQPLGTCSGGPHYFVWWKIHWDDGLTDGWSVEDFLARTTSPATPTITLTSPTGGEQWSAGSVHAITWTASGLNLSGQLQIFWSQDGGQSWTYIDSPTQGTTSYSWTAPLVGTATAQVWVGNAVNGSWQAHAQSANFTIGFACYPSGAQKDGGGAPPLSIVACGGTAPTATTTSASNVGMSEATLNGTVNPNGSSTTAYFQYGTTTNYGSTTGTFSIGSGTAAVPLNYTVSSLTCNTLYHFRMVGQSSVGTTNGSDASWFTSACSPPAIGLSATAMTFNAQQGGGSPLGQELAISNVGGGTLNWSASFDASWLSASSTSGTAPSTISIFANNVVSAATYHGTVTIAAPGASNTPRTVAITFVVSPPAAAPTATTSAASGVGQTSATLNGIVNPNGRSTTAYFQYGTTTSYGSATPTQSLGSGTNSVSVAGGGLSGLACGTTYHYRVTATSDAGTSSGGDASVLTIACSPTITAQPQDQTIAPGQTATLSIVASGTGPLSYQWYRLEPRGTSSAIGGATSASYTTSTLTGSSTYWVRVTNSGGNVDSNKAKISVTFTDALSPGASMFRAVHLAELRMRIDSLRVDSGLAAFNWTDSALTAGSTGIRAQHILDLRAALADVYDALNRARPTYTDPNLGPGYMMKAVHITELRNAVSAIE